LEKLILTLELKEDQTPQWMMECLLQEVARLA
jgi:hypothetical protein